MEGSLLKGSEESPSFMAGRRSITLHWWLHRYGQQKSHSGKKWLTCCFDWWPGTESNRRHKDFQSSALPTELPGLSPEL